MLVSGYARYGTYDVSKVSTYNDSYNDTVSDMTGTAGTLQADKELDANESQQGGLFTNQAPKHSEPADFIFDFRKDSRFNLEGATKDYEDINIDKALYDMKKDTVLDKYKFFVDSPNLGTDKDGTVRIVRR